MGLSPLSSKRNRSNEAGGRSVFRLMSFKLRGLPKNVEVGRMTIDARGVAVEWRI